MMAKHTASQKTRAIKTILKSKIPKDLKNHDSFLREVEILKILDHPNIMKMYESFEDSKNYHLVTEYCSGGELFDYIVSKKNLSEKVACNIMHQLLSVLIYSHSNGIVHRDLKPENLLLEKKPSGSDVQIKVIDWGTSALIEPGDKLKAQFGTPYYIAPEVLNNLYDER